MMLPSKWFNELRQEMSRKRLPAEYAERFTDELLDHYSCLREEHPNMETRALVDRLGNVDQIVAAATIEMRQRTFFGRHPILTFLVAPIPAVVACIVGILMVVFVVGAMIPEAWIHGKAGIVAMSLVLPALAWTVRVLPFVALTVMFSRFATRTGCGWEWGLAASFLLSLFAAVFAVDYSLTTAAPNSGSFMMGLSWPLGSRQLFQFSVTTGVGMWLAHRHYRQSSDSQQIEGGTISAPA